MQVERCKYSIPLNVPKKNGQKLDDKDLINIGYMSGRFGINLDNNPNQPNKPVFNEDKVIVDINSCTTGLFEKNLSQAGISFDVIA